MSITIGKNKKNKTSRKRKGGTIYKGIDLNSIKILDNTKIQENIDNISKLAVNLNRSRTIDSETNKQQLAKDVLIIKKTLEKANTESKPAQRDVLLLDAISKFLRFRNEFNKLYIRDFRSNAAYIQQNSNREREDRERVERERIATKLASIVQLARVDNIAELISEIKLAKNNGLDVSDAEKKLYELSIESSNKQFQETGVRIMPGGNKKKKSKKIEKNRKKSKKKSKKSRR